MASNPLDQAYALMQQGALDAAEALCRTSLQASHGRQPQAWTMLGLILRQRGNLEGSESAYRRALALTPNDLYALHSLGALLSQLERPEEALEALERARALGLGARELQINRGRVLFQLGRAEEAEQAYAIAVAMAPRDPVAQANLAQLRFMRGDPAFLRDLEAAARAHRDDVALQLALGNIRRGSGDPEGAAALFSELLARTGPVPQIHAALAGVLHELGDLEPALAYAEQAAGAHPENPAFLEGLVAITLSLGRADAALALMVPARRRYPLDQRWIAYEATALRLAGDARYHALCDYPRLVRAYDLAPPPGWNSGKEFNTALAAVLRARHQLRAHPLDQSLRAGTQTTRSLLTDREPLIQALIAAFAAPIADYLASLGTGSDHPLVMRNRGRAVLQGCWSVELRRGGFHVSHVHPQGWISSAYYVAVPAEARDPQVRSGWLHFGSPAFPVPGLGPDHQVAPVAGRLVLFPSYLWHGTNPLHGEERRLSVAFDAVPAL